MFEQPTINLQEQPPTQGGWLDTAHEERLIEEHRNFERVASSDNEQNLRLVGSTAEYVCYVRNYQKSIEAPLVVGDGSIMRKAWALIAGDLTEQQLRMAASTSQRDLIRQESKIGSTLFGDIPDGNRREFFCLDPQTWVWHEEWEDSVINKRREVTTRYEVTPSGVLKVQDGMPYQVIEGEELKHLAVATRMYYEQVMTDIYNRNPATGELMRPDGYALAA